MTRVAQAAAAIALLVAASAVMADVEVTTGYKTILRSGAKVGNSPHSFGQILDQWSMPIYKVDKNGSRTNELLISNEPDFSSLLEVEAEDGSKKLFLVTHFEAPRPATQYVVELSQAADGTLTPKSMQYVDWSHLGGLWIPCAGSRTPWGTHLAGEEYEPDAKPFSMAKTLDELKAMAGGSWGDIVNYLPYFNMYPKTTTFNAVKARFNPYKYGHIVETTVHSDGSASVEKWYTLGRAAWELAIIMPDQKTVYGTDDGTNVGFFKFVADTAGDLSSGRLYAGRFTQTNSKGGGAFRVNWIHLGHGQNDDLKDLAETTTFADIFETASFDSTLKRCPAGFKSINQDDVGVECLKLKPGMATAAAFLETRRYAAYKGATTEFSKWEGITYDPKRKALYTSMSNIRYGMENQAAKGSANPKYDIGGPNHVKLQYNKCGCVYKLNLDAKFNVYAMSALTCGKNNPDTADTANECALDAIANPDNVAYIPEIDTLLIAEDTEYHENDVLWAYDLKSNTMQRMMTSVYGAEVTSAYWYSNINGNAYTMAVVQHPYESPFDTKASEPESSGIDAWIGYFTWKTSAMDGATGAKFAGIDYSKTNAEKHSVRSLDKITFVTGPKRAGRKL